MAGQLFLHAALETGVPGKGKPEPGSGIGETPTSGSEKAPIPSLAPPPCVLGTQERGESPSQFFRSQIALRALETCRSGKRCPDIPPASCVALAEAYELPVNRNQPG